MSHALIDKYRQFKNWKHIVWNAHRDYNIPFSKRVKYAFRGFSVDEYVWYNLEKNDYKDYISEYERMQAREINGPYKFILDDKLIFEEVVGKYVRVPKNYAWIKNGSVYELHDSGINNSNIAESLKKFGTTVLKWNGRGGGEGTYVISWKDDAFDVNGERKDSETVEKLFDRHGEAILCEYMTQSSFAASLYPHTTNTIRIVCAKKKGEHDARFITAIQRVGCQDSIPVDNVSSGGLTLEINPETGELGEGIAKYGRKDRVMVLFKNHPDTDEPFVGKKIPDWNNLVKQIVDLTNKFPYLNFVAWDILLTEEGFCMIEGNASSGCGIFQMKKGVKDSALGDVLRSYKII